MTQRTTAIALFGGSFDPVHNAHVEVVKYVLAKLNPRQVWVIPCHLPPHKNRLHASGDQRVAMLKLAMEDLPRVIIDQRELRRDAISYTYDTVSEIRAECGGEVSLYLVIGWDSWLNFTTWHRWRELLVLVNLVVLKRPSVKQHADLREHEKLLVYLRGHRVESDKLARYTYGKIAILDMPKMNIASQDIRDMLCRGNVVDTVLPGLVVDYIRSHGLYSYRV